MSATSPRSRVSNVSAALARDRLGVPAVVFFVLGGVAPLTVAAGVIPTAYATTGADRYPGRIHDHRCGARVVQRRLRSDGPACGQQLGRPRGEVPAVAGSFSARPPSEPDVTVSWHPALQ